MQQEIWKDIPDYEGMYQVSNYGRVRSLNRIIHGKDGVIKTYRGRILQMGTSMGYSFVNLYKGCKGVSIKVHRLVGLLFVDNPKNRTEIDHINTNRKDNRPENLRWVNRSENNLNPITRKRMSDVKRKNK